MREPVQAIPAALVQSSEVSLGKGIVAVVFFATQLCGVGCGDRLESVFANVKEARSSGAVARGWVPNDLPESATDLRERHDLDTNEVWGILRLPATEHPSSITLRRVEASKITGHAVRSPRVSWWPEMLTGNLDGRVLEQHGFEFYSTLAPFEFWIAIDRNRGRGFFWSGAP
jgi:hypothetical protein